MHPCIHLFGINIPTFTVVMLLAIFVSMAALLLRQNVYMSLRRCLLRFLPMILLAAGITGRLLSAIILTIDGNNSFWHNLIFGGCVYYGAVAGGLLAGFLLCKKYNLDVLCTVDVSLSALPLAQAIGRFGCWLNGCCYGKVTDSAFSLLYKVDEVCQRVYPTWFIESAVCAALWIIVYFTPIKRRGIITAIYCIGYGCARFAIEFLRGDTVRGIFGSLSTSQYISIPLVIIGVLILIKENVNKRENLYIY